MWLLHSNCQALDISLSGPEAEALQTNRNTQVSGVNCAEYHCTVYIISNNVLLGILLCDDIGIELLPNREL